MSPKPLAIELDFDRPEAPMLIYDDTPEIEGEGDPEDEDYMTMVQDEVASKLGIGLA